MIKDELSIDPFTLDEAIKKLGMLRRLEDFGNAGECSSLLDRAKMKLAARKSANPRGNSLRPNHLLLEDFIGEETSADKARDAVSDLEAVDHILAIIEELEVMMRQAKKEGREPASIVDSAHMIFVGPPGIMLTTIRMLCLCLK